MSLASPLADPQLAARLQGIRLLALDVDGVLTDGRLHFQSDGTEIKAFHTLDGHGLKLLKRVGIEVALITGRDSPIVSHRAAALGISHVHQGVEIKYPVLLELCRRLGIALEKAAYCGDDLPDLGAIRHAGVGISVPGAPAYIRADADWVTQRPGGQGAVREICDTLLEAQGHLVSILDSYRYDQGR